MSSFTIMNLRHRCMAREAEALEKARAHYACGIAAMDEHRLADAACELKQSRNFMDLTDLFASQVDALTEMLHSEQPDTEYMQNQMEFITSLLQQS